MARWADLDAELDAWAKTGRKALLWWRDDDAGALTPALERLLALHEATKAPLSLAVIPQEASGALAERLIKLPGVAVLQHGFAHRNHALAGEKKSEFPGNRPVAESLADLRSGQAQLKKLFGRSLRPILVPPWNRIAANLLPQLPRLGLHGFSTYKARDDLWAAPGLMQVNTHLDPADWRQEAKFLGDDACLALALAQLRLARLDPAAPEPLGLLTHHARHDEAGWAFIARFISHVAGHGAALWVDVESAFGAGPPPTGASSVTSRS